MPIYEYLCKDCQKTFSIIQAMTEHGKAAVKCPHCSSSQVEQLFTGFFAKTESKS